MYLYFFDLDDTICDTYTMVEDIHKRYSIIRENYTQDEYNSLIESKLAIYGFTNVSPLNNSTFAFLKQLVVRSPEDVYFITARQSNVRDQSKEWLQKHNIWLGENKLIMDTNGIKGKIINSILNENSSKQFAFLFDDLEDNHKEAASYKKIISCLPF